MALADRAARGATVPDSADLISRLRAGEEAAFRTLVRRYQGSLVSVALGFVRDRATAEELVQDTWLAVIEGLDSFEQRSSLKNWIFAIVANRARTRAVRDGRTITVANFSGEAEGDDPAVDPSRFDAGGMWIAAAAPRDEITPERVVAGRQLWSQVAQAIERLPPAQRAVLVMRDVEQLTAGEVAGILGITDANQRVILHRARARIRQFIEDLTDS